MKNRKFNLDFIGVICWSGVLVCSIIRCYNGEPASHYTAICAPACLILCYLGNFLIKKIDELDAGEDEDEEEIYR